MLSASSLRSLPALAVILYVLALSFCVFPRIAYQARLYVNVLGNTCVDVSIKKRRIEAACSFVFVSDGASVHDSARRSVSQRIVAYRSTGGGCHSCLAARAASNPAACRACIQAKGESSLMLSRGRVCALDTLWGFVGLAAEPPSGE